MSQNNGVVVTFDSVQQAMQGEHRLRETLFVISLIVTPRAVSSNCGFSLFVTGEGVEMLGDIMNSLQIKYKTLYQKFLREGIVCYERC